MVIEPVHCGSSSILKVRFLGHPEKRNQRDISVNKDSKDRKERLVLTIKV